MHIAHSRTLLTTVVIAERQRAVRQATLTGPAHLLLLTLMAISLAAPAAAQITIPGADGSDLPFTPTENTVVDLALADTAVWNDTNPNPGEGVYDPDKWAVVFRYTEVNIPGDVTVTFTNHPSRAPVVWLVSGSVTIDGTLDLSGANGHDGGAAAAPSEPGPGGFRGGRGSLSLGTSEGSGGYGPGGASYNINDATHHGSGGSYGSLGVVGGVGGGPVGPTYGNERILPLIGGSGGAGARIDGVGRGAGAGGGAILIAAASVITVEGTIKASGGGMGGGTGSYHGGCGSGGAIRLVCNNVLGTGLLHAEGGNFGNGGDGGDGRIRVESNDNQLSDPGSPAYTEDLPGDPATLWPTDGPTIKATTIFGQAVPADPEARLEFPNSDVMLSNPLPDVLLLEAQNMPLDWIVTVRVTRKSGQDLTWPAEIIGGVPELSTWQVPNLQLENGFSAIQIRAEAP